MTFQGFSPKIGLAMAIAKAKKAKANPMPIDQAEKDRLKQLAQVRNDKRLAENLAQRALIQSHPDR
jgi:hypothetical protein